ncbi:MAG: 2'-5' RNA ligase family protein [bacterium]
MQKFTQKYTIICLLEDIEEGYNFHYSNWPLHTTLIDTFAIDWDVNTLQTKLQEVAQEQNSTTTTGTQSEYFGPNKEVHVTLLNKNEDLKSIHYALMQKLNEGNLILNDPQYHEEGYLPHSTVQKLKQVKVGEKVNINNLALIDMFLNEDPHERKILKIIKLK